MPSPSQSNSEAIPDAGPSSGQGGLFWRQAFRPLMGALLAGVACAVLVDLYQVQWWRRAAVASAAPSQRWDGPLELLPAATLAQMADDADPFVRRHVVEELGRRGAIEELARLLGHPRADVRSQVPEALMAASQRAHDRIPLLAEGLQSPDEATREATAEALLILVRARGPYRGVERVTAGAATQVR